MTLSQRAYKTKDVDMIVTTSTIAENAIANKDFLQTKRATWADPYFQDLKKKIDIAAQQFLGVDSAKDLRMSTAIVLQVQSTAMRDLGDTKLQISEDFKTDRPRRDEILRQLGFTTYLKDAQKGDQEGLINLLFQFKTNLSISLRAEIAAAGTSSAALDNIMAYADKLKAADITQETFKSSKKVLTAAALHEFNDIYSTVISIAKIAARFYKDQPHLKDQFTYSKISKALNTKAGTSPASVPAP